MRVLASIAGIFLVCSLAQASTIYSNIAAEPTDSDHVRAFGPLYDSFSTDSAGGRLSELKLMLSVDNPDSTRILRIVLFADDSGSPGSRIARLGTVAESALTILPDVYDVDLTTHPLLAPNTRYWIGLRRGPNTLWAWSADTSGTGVGSEFFSNTDGTFSNNPGGPYQMSVSTSADVSVPEPQSVVLLSISIVAFGVLRRFTSLS